MALKAPHSRAIHRDSRSSSMSCDEYDEEGSQNANLEEGLSFFDSFQETPKNRSNSSASFDSYELALNEAVNGALVGENVLDSPNAPRRKTKRIVLNAPAQPQSTPLRRSNNNSDNDNSPTSSDSLSGMSAGLFTQGFAWIRGQRDERRRKTLQMQAEEQAQKIREAQWAEKQQHQPDGAHNSDSNRSPRKDSHDAAATSRGLEDNTTFQNLANMIPRSAVTCGQDLDGVNESSTEFFDSHQHHSSSNSAGGSEDDGGGVAVEDDIIQKTEVSRSGDGYVVEFAVPDAHQDDADWVPPVRIQTEDSTTPHILSEDQRQCLAQHVLPTGIAYAKWKRLYSLARDGDSFDACLRLITGHAQTLMVVRTAANDILGGFADYSWDHPTIGGTQYFGGPTSCIYSFAATTTISETSSNKLPIRVYKWTGANRYIQLCDREHKMLAFGGGGEDGEFGLAVAQDFQHGSSGPCDTFGNEPLLSSNRQFEIVDLEIYCFLLGQF